MSGSNLMTIAARDSVETIVIGASAGAVEALSVILPALPKQFPLAVAVVVHIPADRTSAMVELFQARCRIAIREAEDKEPIQSGTVYFAPPDYHLLVERDRRFSLSSEAPVQYSRPSIDVLFESAADVYGPALVGVVLSGANCDGADGLKTIHDSGGIVLVQSPRLGLFGRDAAGRTRRLPGGTRWELGADRGLSRESWEDAMTLPASIPSIPVNILLVDDLKENLLALEGLLRRDGLVLFQVQSGREALELLLVHEVALALIDVQMPDMDGFELAELMRGTARTRRVPIIFLTAGSPDRQRRFRGYETGAVDFLTKPIESHVLLSKVDVFLELWRERQEVARQRDELRVAAAENARLLEETRRTAEALREADRRKDEFLATLAHELRNPLAPLRNGLQVLKLSPTPYR